MKRDFVALKNHRILNYITGLNIGGAELMLARFARNLSGSRYQPQILSLMTPGPVSDMLRTERVPVDTLGMSESSLSVAAIGRLRSISRTSGCNLFHGWMYHGNVAASVGSYLGLRQPVIWSIHHSIDDMSREKSLTRLLIALSARLSGGTSAISYCSRISADQHEALGFDTRKRVVIPNGIDCTEFAPDPAGRTRLSSTFGIPSDRLIVGNVARAHPMKDHEGFVRTLSLLLADGFNVHGLIIGAGHEEGAARRLARQLGIDDRLTTPGSRSDVAALLPGLDAFLLSSAWGEAFPLSVGEAMASGVPVAVTDVGDSAWLAGDRALVSPPRDPAAQAEVLARLFRRSPEDRRQVGLAGRGRVLGQFSMQSYTNSHIRLYEEALASGRGDRRAA